jgi:PAS domain S-box
MRHILQEIKQTNRNKEGVADAPAAAAGPHREPLRGEPRSSSGTAPRGKGRDSGETPPTREKDVMPQENRDALGVLTRAPASSPFYPESEEEGALGASPLLAGRDALDTALLETLLHNAPLGIALLDTDLRFVRVNAALAAVHGIAAERHLGRRLADLLPRFPRRLLPLLERVLETGKPLVNLELSDLSDASPEEGRAFLASYYPVYEGTPGETPLGIGIIVVDITERKRAQEAALAAERRAAGRMRQFLREILNSVTEGRLQLCDDERDLPVGLPVVAGTFAVSGTNLKVAREAVRKAAVERGFSDERWQDLVTAVGEAGMNAVVHGGGGGVVTVRATPLGAANPRVQVWVEDGGTGIELYNLHRATLGRGFSTRGTFGHGFYLMLNTCDRLYLWTRPTGTTVVIEQSPQLPEPSWMQDDTLFANFTHHA